MIPTSGAAGATSRPAGDGREVVRATRRRAPDGTLVEEREWRAAPGWAPVAEHRHPATQERHEILAGAARVVVDGADRTYRAGESVIVAAGQTHALLPVEGRGVHVRVQRWTPPPTA